MYVRKIRLLVLALSFGFLAVPSLRADTWAAPSTATYESSNEGPPRWRIGLVWPDRAQSYSARGSVAKRMPGRNFLTDRVVGGTSRSRQGASRTSLANSFKSLGFTSETAQKAMPECTQEMKW